MTVRLVRQSWRGLRDRPVASLCPVHIQEGEVQPHALQ